MKYYRGYNEIHSALTPECNHLGNGITQIASHAVEFHECQSRWSRRDDVMEYLPMPRHELQRVGDAR